MLTVCYSHPSGLTEPGCTANLALPAWLPEEFLQNCSRLEVLWNSPSREHPVSKESWYLGHKYPSPLTRFILFPRFFPVELNSSCPLWALVQSRSWQAAFSLLCHIPTLLLLVPEPSKCTHCSWIPVSRSASGRTHTKLDDVKKRTQDLKVEDLGFVLALSHVTLTSISLSDTSLNNQNRS